jgi:hypothetical protein
MLVATNNVFAGRKNNGGNTGSGYGHMFWSFMAYVDTKILAVKDQQGKEHSVYIPYTDWICVWHRQQTVFR